METVLETIGLETPWKRFLIPFLILLGLELWWKPNSSFLVTNETSGKAGEPPIPKLSLKKWAVLTGSGPDSTYLPLGLAPFLIAGVLATFF